MDKTLKALNIKALDGKGKGTAVFATLNVVDRDGDITLPGAFGEQIVKILPAHEWRHVPIGKGRTYETAEEALCDFQLNLEIESARDWHSALKFDLANGAPIQEWSYGYGVVQSSHGDQQGRRVRMLKRLKVTEISPVVVGAGVNTRTLGMKGRKLADQIEGARAEIADLVERVAGLKDLRAEEGRELPKERREQLVALQEDLKRLGAVADIIGGLAAAGATDSGLGRRLLTEFLAAQSRIAR